MHRLGPRVELARRVAAGVLRPDPAQAAAVDAFERLHARVAGYTPPPRAQLDWQAHVRDEHERLRRAREQQQQQQRRRTELPPLEPKFVPPRGLYMHGPVGVGKTMLMDLFYDTVATDAKRRVHFHTFMQTVFSRIHSWNSMCDHGAHKTRGPVFDVADWLMDNAWLICFDEFQVTDMATATVLSTLFQCLIDRGAVIVTTSNRRLEDLYAGGFQRQLIGPLVQMLQRHCEVVPLDGGRDYRAALYDETHKAAPGGVSAQHQTFLWPLGPDTARRLRERFDERTRGHTVGPASLVHAGRELRIPAASHDTAWFTFNSLCREPWGPAEYMQLCRRFAAVFVEGIPQLTIKQRNEARRLITLIDAAYEHRVKLHCSAHDEPERLFGLVQAGDDTDAIDVMQRETLGDIIGEQQPVKGPLPSEVSPIFLEKLAIFTGEDEKFAFQRAASRLREMQSAQYLSRAHVPHEVDLMHTGQRQPTPDFSHGGDPSAPGETAASDGAATAHASPDRVTDDFADEYSGSVQRVDFLRRRAQRASEQPRFRDQHFWGAGWWESVTRIVRAKPFGRARKPSGTDGSGKP